MLRFQTRDRLSFEGVIYPELHPSDLDKITWKKEECWLGRLNEPLRNLFQKGSFPSSSIVMSIPRNGLNQVGGALEILSSEENRKEEGRGIIIRWWGTRLCDDDLLYLTLLDFRVMRSLCCCRWYKIWNRKIWFNETFCTKKLNSRRMQKVFK